VSYEFIQVDVRGHVTTITLNRPQVMNAINRRMHVEMQTALDTFSAANDQHVCVVTGSGDRAFCAGSDLKEAAAASAAADWSYPRSGYAGLIERFDLNKPLLAAVNGLAFGGGFEIALACDIIIASQNARFALPEPLVGAVALGGGLHRLARQIGLKPALGMILTARHVSAQEALRLGLVNEVVPAGELQSASARWCEQILKCSPAAIRASKETVLRGLDEITLADGLRNQAHYPGFAAWMSSPDRREGPKAFAEKRSPQWRDE
jgi:crotonobetainyl-CoA hydratase